MEKQKLENLVNIGLTVREIASRLNQSYTNTRYWLGKHGLKTNVMIKRKDGCCRHCKKSLTGNQTSFCSKNCNVKFIYSNEKTVNKRKDRKFECVKHLGGKCITCGYNKNLSALVFHHRQISEKSFEINARNISSMSMDDVMKEVNKCDLLCQNCHMELHNPHWNM